MANPAIVECPAGEITLAAENVTTGRIKVIDNNPAFYAETYRMTGDAAPTSQSEFAPFRGSLEIDTTDPIDVYIYAAGRDGAVRRDV